MVTAASGSTDVTENVVPGSAGNGRSSISGTGAKRAGSLPFGVDVTDCTYNPAAWVVEAAGTTWYTVSVLVSSTSTCTVNVDSSPGPARTSRTSRTDVAGKRPRRASGPLTSYVPSLRNPYD